MHVCGACETTFSAYTFPEPEKRMGAPAIGAGGAAEVKDQPPLLGFNFRELTDGAMKSPLATRAANVIRSSADGSEPSGAAGAEAPAPEFAPAPPTAKEWVASFDGGAAGGER